MPRVEVPGGSRPADSAGNSFDQGFVDKKVSGFEGQGHVSGQRQPGDTPDAEAPAAPELAQFRKANGAKWQAQKDAGARDRLFAQPTAGRVDGQEVGAFSERALAENATALVAAKTAKVDRALPLERRNILKVAAITAAITAPLTVGLTLAANVGLEYLKPLINPPKTPATEEHVKESLLVDNAQRSVFVLANTLADLRSEPHVSPSVEWLAKTNDERMDYLDEMLDYLEPEFAKEAGALGIQTQAPSTGAQEDDIKSRATGVESRMAYLNELMGAMKDKYS
ncbi:hypothetical protein [Pseudomonas sp. ICMP 460]|uniref:hypothetical protein n=1 Tax=Pseudomonas sp. ICMP 460 TaxID=1718917 RepID=UPI00117A225F|nr:hypothetical protein [Pseudomonas sp. ICMP 460]